MNKNNGYYLALSILGVILPVAVLSWLTWRVLPDLGMVHLVPLEAKAHPLPQNGYAILIFKN